MPVFEECLDASTKKTTFSIPNAQLFVRIGRQYHVARQNFMSYPQYLLYLMAIKTSGHRITTTPPLTYKIYCL